MSYLPFLRPPHFLKLATVQCETWRARDPQLSAAVPGGQTPESVLLPPGAAPAVVGVSIATATIPAKAKANMFFMACLEI